MQKYIIFTLLIVLSTKAFSQGPIYNFNFFNENGVKKESNIKNPSVEKINQIQTQNNDEEQTPWDLSKKHFIGISFGQGSKYGPFGSSDFDSYEKSYILNQKFELLLGFELTSNFSLVMSGNSQRLKLRYYEQYDSKYLGINDYKGKAYGGSIGPQYNYNFTDKFIGFVGISYAYSVGKLNYPYYIGQKHKMGRGKYTEKGLEFGAGFDYHIRPKIMLGLSGKIGDYDILLSPLDGQRDPASEMDRVIKDNSTKTQLVAQLKFLI